MQTHSEKYRERKGMFSYIMRPVTLTPKPDEDPSWAQTQNSLAKYKQTIFEMYENKHILLVGFIPGMEFIEHF